MAAPRRGFGNPQLLSASRSSLLLNKPNKIEKKEKEQKKKT
jgi:hypothetical protein